MKPKHWALQKYRIEQWLLELGSMWGETVERWLIGTRTEDAI